MLHKRYDSLDKNVKLVIGMYYIITFLTVILCLLFNIIMLY